MSTISIPLTQGKFAIIDAEDFALVSQFKWRAVRLHNRWYAHAWDASTKPRRLIALHRLIMGFPEEQVDHKNLNGLDCTRDNLRLATHGQNKANSPRYKSNKSGYKGVYPTDNESKPWAAEIRAEGKLYWLGAFSSPEEAAAVYNIAAKKLHGTFARGNETVDTMLIAPEVQDNILAKKHLRSDNQTGYKGVSRIHVASGSYRARFRGSNLGSFSTPEEAARAYDAKARELLGDRARLNFPE